LDFKTEETSANIYNIYALNMFGRGAIINDVELNAETRIEMQTYFDTVWESEHILNKAKEVLQKHQAVIKVYNKV